MSDATDSLANLLSLANAARVRLWPEEGSIHYRSPDPLSPDLKAAVVANKPALLDALAVWDADEASRLEREADDLAGGCGCGLDREVQKFAALCAWAHHREMMATVRRCCAVIEERARKLEALMRSAA